MRKELTDLLYQRYPAIFAEILRHQESEDAAFWKIWCRDGWFDLIDTLCVQLQSWTDARNAPQYVVVDVKEKLGTLRFVGRYKSPEQIGALKMAYALSARICEECGAPGRVVVAGCTLMARCEQHTPEGAITEAEHDLLREKQIAERQAPKAENDSFP